MKKKYKKKFDSSSVMRSVENKNQPSTNEEPSTDISSLDDANISHRQISVKHVQTHEYETLGRKAPIVEYPVRGFISKPANSQVITFFYFFNGSQQKSGASLVFFMWLFGLFRLI